MGSFDDIEKQFANMTPDTFKQKAAIKAKDPPEDDKAQESSSDEDGALEKSQEEKLNKEIDNFSERGEADEQEKTALEVDGSVGSPGNRNPVSTDSARKSLRVKTKPKKTDRPRLRQVRDLPDSQLQAVTEELGFDDSLTNNLAVYLALKTGVTEDLTERQLALLDQSLMAEGPLVSVYNNLAALQNDMDQVVDLIKALIKKIDRQEIIIFYLLQDRLGFNPDAVSGPGDINFRTERFNRFMGLVSKEAETYFKEKELRAGRASYDQFRRGPKGPAVNK